jgi:hypothetical protein
MKLPLHRLWKHFGINLKSKDSDFENEFIKRFNDNNEMKRKFSDNFVYLYEGTDPENLNKDETKMD